MKDNNYNLAILKNVLKARKRILNENELKEFIASPVYLNAGYLASAALLARSGSISMEEFLDLRFLKEEELEEFLESVGNDFDYFKEDANEDIVKAFSQMEEFIRTHPLEAEKNSRLRKERIAKIKEFHEQIQSSIQRGA